MKELFESIVKSFSMYENTLYGSNEIYNPPPAPPPKKKRIGLEKKDLLVMDLGIGSFLFHVT